MRGEDKPKALYWTAYSETPPLARGRLEAQVSGAAASGNTPACAGKTNNRRYDLRQDEKHPRLRGEDTDTFGKRLTGRETPPLARGRQKIKEGDTASTRNTPACAGKTVGNKRRRDEQQKHPRLRGEDSGRQKRNPRAPETPPLARGRQLGIEVQSYGSP